MENFMFCDRLSAAAAADGAAAGADAARNEAGGVEALSHFWRTRHPGRHSRLSGSRSPTQLGVSVRATYFGPLLGPACAPSVRGPIPWLQGPADSLHMRWLRLAALGCRRRAQVLHRPQPPGGHRPCSTAHQSSARGATRGRRHGRMGAAEARTRRTSRRTRLQSWCLRSPQKVRRALPGARPDPCALSLRWSVLACLRTANRRLSRRRQCRSRVMGTQPQPCCLPTRAPPFHVASVVAHLTSGRPLCEHRPCQLLQPCLETLESRVCRPGRRCLLRSCTGGRSRTGRRCRALSRLRCGAGKREYGMAPLCSQRIGCG